MTKDTKMKLVLFGALFLVGIMGVIYSHWLSSLPQIYTIGTIEKIWKPRSGGYEALFKYRLNGKEYTNSSTIRDFDKVAKVGSRFIVEVPEGHLYEGDMLFHLQVKSGVEAPEEGWKKIPKSVLFDKFK
jgi:hypothetical protein